ncbi:bacterial transcriptional activator domain-containing protein [Mycolicibacterium sp. Y3]
MNEQAAKLTRWLLAGNGALKNVAQLLTDAFGPAGAVAATIDAATITAYPADPTAEPVGLEWTPAPQGWSHPLHSQLLPRSTSAHHHVVAGITSRNEVLVVNLAAAAYLGIEGGNAVLMMRSWLMQTLSKTPEAFLAVTDSALAIAGAERLLLIDDPATAPHQVSLILTTAHTSAPADGQAHPILVSSQAAGAANVVLCNEAVAGIYLANRYWPIWRRMEVADPQWTQLKDVLAPAVAAGPAAAQALAPDHLERPVAATTHTGPTTSGNDTSPGQASSPPADPQPSNAMPVTSDNDTSPESAGLVEETPAVDAAPAPAATPEAPHLLPTPNPQPAPTHEPTPLLSGTYDTSREPAPAADQPLGPPPLLTPDIPTPFAQTGHDSGAGAGDLTPLLPGRPAEEPTEPGLYVLGQVYALGLDPETKEPVKHSAVTRQGVRKPVKALMALATSNGVTSTEWEEKILQVTPQNRRQLRTQIRKMMGGIDPIRNDARGLLVVDMFCDWKEFNRLIGHTPESATTEALTAAVRLIRGAPFEDVPDEEYAWRSVQLLKDELIDRCSTAAAELAQRQQAAGAHEAAYRTARLGLSVYAQREDLWLVAANSVTDEERRALIWDLKQAIPVPTHPALRQLLAAARAS